MTNDKTNDGDGLAKSSLGDLLTMMAEVDESLLTLTDQQMAELGRHFVKKVDNYYYFLERVEAEIERYAKRIAEFEAAKATLENKRKKVKEYALLHMRTNGIDRLTGENFELSVKVTPKNRTEFRAGFEKPNSDLFMQFSDYIVRKYTWDKSAVKRALRAGDPRLRDVATLADSVAIVPAVRKEFKTKQLNERTNDDESTGSSNDNE